MDERNLWIHTFTWILGRNQFHDKNFAKDNLFFPGNDEIQITGKSILATDFYRNMQMQLKSRETSKDTDKDKDNMMNK